MKFIHKGQAFGIEPGKYVRISQGCTPKDEQVKAKGDALPGDQCFQEFDTVPPLIWGTGIYLVKKDSKLLLLSSDFDSSD